MSKETDNIEKLISDKNMQFRDFTLVKAETRKKEDDSEELVVEGIPCVFDTETVLYKVGETECREKIDSDAFLNADMTDVIFNFNHGGRVFSRTRNKTLELWEEPDGLHMRAHLRKNDRGHEELYNDIQNGLIDKMSFAFTVSEDSFEYRDKGKIELRTIKRIDKLYDVSAVDIPAYDTTRISARGAFDAERQMREAESRKHEQEINLARARYNYINI